VDVEFELHETTRRPYNAQMMQYHQTSSPPTTLLAFTVWTSLPIKRSSAIKTSMNRLR